MDKKQRILAATMELLEEKDPSEVTIREISRKAETALGLVSYYFGSREKLIEECVEKIINGIVDRFTAIREEAKDLPPEEKLAVLGELTLTFLFEHEAISRISIETDMHRPRLDDNTHRTFAAFRPLVKACRPDLSEEALSAKTFALISTMQSTFMRSRVLLATEGLDLRNDRVRSAYHRSILAILGIIKGGNS